MGQTPSIVDIPDEWGEILAHLSVDDIARCSRERVSQERDTVYLNGRVFDMDERTVDLCVAILDAHAHLNGTRFQLVPGRMVSLGIRGQLVQECVKLTLDFLPVSKDRGKILGRSVWLFNK